MSLAKQEILNFDREELTNEFISSLGFERFRADQVTRWVYKERLREFETMSDVAKGAREELSKRFQIGRPQIVTVQESTDGTRKYLFELADGARVESVLIKQPTRYTLCVSSQVGCAIGCKFCRSALMGLKRNLETSEIIGQVLAVKDDISGLPDSPSAQREFNNIVFMGMGEPLHNVDNVIRTTKILNDPLGLNFPARKITVSTSGLVPAIQKLGASGAPARLAVSLNATTDEVRTKLIPINKKWPLAALIGALREYPLGARHSITIEYVMLAGVNDTAGDLHRLPRLLHGLKVKLNLIPYNENSGLGFNSSSRDHLMTWQRELSMSGLNTRIRWSRGEDISAACGQLATQNQ